MEIKKSDVGSSLHIASEVIEKIAGLAAMEVEGVVATNAGNTGMKTLLNKIVPQNAVRVEMKDNVADVTISIVVKYGAKISEVGEKVQQNVKASIQNMTQISVAKVNIVVAGVAMEKTQAEQDIPAE